MAAAVEKIDVSAPVLVYERPRFTEPMFAKARDAPIRPRKDQESPTRASNSPTKSLPPTGPTRSTGGTDSSVSKPEETLMRRLSARARSFSSFRRDSTRSESSSKPRSRSFSAKMSRRLSGLFRNNSFSSSTSFSEQTRPKEDLIVYVEES